MVARKYGMRTVAPDARNAAAAAADQRLREFTSHLAVMTALSRFKGTAPAEFLVRKLVCSRSILCIC